MARPNPPPAPVTNAVLSLCTMACMFAVTLRYLPVRFSLQWTELGF